MILIWTNMGSFYVFTSRYWEIVRLKGTYLMLTNDHGVNELKIWNVMNKITGKFALLDVSVILFLKIK